LHPETEDVVLVQVNGIAAPVFAVAPTQVNFQVPWELAGLPEASLTVTVSVLRGSPATVSLRIFRARIVFQPTLPAAGKARFSSPTQIPSLRRKGPLWDRGRAPRRVHRRFTLRVWAR
jgi:uncharacterized protein (TIGR03437 family)